MKKILGLDLGTNSIGAAIINIPESFEDYGKEGKIEWIGSRIIPMDGFVSTETGKPFKENPLDSFSKGVGISKAAARRIKRGSRKLKQRYKLRRNRLIKVFKVLGWVDNSFPEDFKKVYKTNENFKFHISDYLPFSNENIDEAKELLGTKNNKGEITLPEDWIVYYLRKKALTQKITFSELARITYMMNQRRGFKSSRKDLKDESVEEIKWVETLKIKSVEQETFEPDKSKNFKFKVTPDSERVQPWTVKKKKKPEWEGKEYTLLITEKIETKEGTKEVTQLTPKIPQEGDWGLCTTALDNKIGDEYPGTYFFNGLVESVKNKTNFKIRQYAVYRSKYKKELEAIWKKQIELNDDLKKINKDESILRKLAEVLYPTQTRLNKPKLKEILSKDLLRLISEDIIYYKRDLKSQKGYKSVCQYEGKKGIDGEWYGLKCAPKSSPEFQEFRIWQDVHNIKVLQRNGTKEKVLEDGTTKKFDKIDIDVSSHYIRDDVREALFYLFDNSKKIKQNQIIELINQFNPENQIDLKTHRINMFFEEDRELVGNETKEYFRKIFKKFDYEEKGEQVLSDKDKFYRLWSISYSISLNDEEKSKEAIYRAISNSTNKRGKTKKITFGFPEEIALAIASAPDIEATKKYAAYSSKAINKLLPLMRCGRYWNENSIEQSIKEKIKNISERLNKIGYNANKIISVSDDNIPQQILKSFIEKKDFAKGLNTYQACYLVYDRHSEKVDYKKYSSVSEFDILKLLPNNSLRNPVVEQVVRETLFVVRDLWEQYGQPDEIHIELARELKKNAKERKSATEVSTGNFQERQRIKKVLYELMNEEFEQYENLDNSNNIVKNKAQFEIKPNPESPIDINRFRLWKNMSGISDTELDKRIKEEKIPKNQEIKKYALWLSQKCISPYTGKIIPLSKLFDPGQYEIEHILPKGLIKNDSFDNQVIAEWGVNKAKSRELGALFIANRNGKCEYGGKTYPLLDYDAYIAHCKATFKGRKLKNLLATEIPDDFISRQINDTRYITRKITELLYPVAKGKKDAETDAEKGGIVFTIGAITSELKNEWGLQKVWKKLLKPRFERLEKLNDEKYIFQNKKDANDVDYNVKESEVLDIKRIDHRHHALDALIIAATTIEHIRYLNSLSAADTNEEIKNLKRKLVKGKIRKFSLPWETFTKEAKEILEETVVTFKSNNKVFSNPLNKYQKWQLVDGKWEKVFVKQEANKKWFAVRKSLFKEPQGIIYIKEIETKSFRTPNDILKIVKLQIERMNAQNTPKQKTTSYIYDQETREVVKQVIDFSGGDLERIKKYLKNFKPKNINGEPIYTVRIAVFKPYAAKRVKLDKSFDHKKIDKIPYGDKVRMSEDRKMTIPQILHQHLEEFEENAKKRKEIEGIDEELRTEDEKQFLEIIVPEPFSDEGLEILDKKVGTKIRMVTLKEEIGLKKKLQNKLVEADGNPYFVFYENEITKERLGFSSLSTYDMIQKKLEGKPILAPKENHRIQVLQSNDLVYVPTNEQIQKIAMGISIVDAIDFKNRKQICERLYVVNDFSKTDIYFKPNSFSKAIKARELHTSYDEKCSRFIHYNSVDESEKEDGLIIKTCIKVKFDRLGNIILREDDYLYLKMKETENEKGLTLDEFKQTLFDESDD
jgi:CRISPR-associated endonuclease Csn1